MQFPDRTEAIIIHARLAREAETKGDFALARLSYFKWVESLRQQNVNTGGALEKDLAAAQRAYSAFAGRDPLYLKICGDVLSYIASHPGVLQTDLYKEFPAFSQEDLRYALYFAGDHGKIKREKKGQTYTLTAA